MFKVLKNKYNKDIRENCKDLREDYIKCKCFYSNDNCIIEENLFELCISKFDKEYR